MNVTSSAPRPGALDRRGRARRRRQRRWLIIPLSLVLVLGGYGAWVLTRSQTSATVTTTTATVSRGPISVTVSGSGTVAAAASRDLAFPVSGVVSEVLVSVGDTVTAGQPLARLEDTALRLALQQARANLTSAQAQLAAANGEGATPEEIAAARARLRSAQAQYAQTVNGSATAADLAAARAQLAAAQAQLDALLAGPTAAELVSAQAAVEQAELALQSQRATLSTAKTRAESQVSIAANALREAQDSYSTLYWQNRQAEKAPGGLSQSAKDQEAAAQRAVADAEEALKQARLAYEQARQDEVIGIQQAEASLASARRTLQSLQAGPTEAEIAAARAAVASAQANLANLQQPATAAAKAIAQASVDEARIALEQLTSPAGASAIASAEASVAQARVAVTEAEQNLEDATLVAPFDGVVAAVNLAAGASAASGAITVIDPARLYVELNLSESDVAGVVVGQEVALSFDALPDARITGTVTAIAPAATVISNVAAYPVRVSFEPGEYPIKVGMSVSGAITTQRHADAIIVPSRAIETRGDVSLVRVQRAAGQPPVLVRVTTGLSSDGQTEVLSCVDTGNQCLQAGDLLLVTSASAATSGSANRNQNGFGGFGGPAGGPPPGMGR